MIEIRDLDECTTKVEIADALSTSLNAPHFNKDVVKTLRKAYAGTQAAVAALPDDLAAKALILGHIRIGWVNCRIHGREDTLRCYRCWSPGHVSTHCKGSDPSAHCFRGGQTGHQTKVCKKNPTDILAPRITSCAVSELYTHSDHQAIVFEIETARPPRPTTRQSCKWNARTLDSESLLVMIANAAVPPGPTEKMAMRLMATITSVHGVPADRCLSSVLEKGKACPAAKAKASPRGTIVVTGRSVCCTQRAKFLKESSCDRLEATTERPGGPLRSSVRLSEGTIDDQRHRERHRHAREAIAGKRWNRVTKKYCAVVTLDVKNAFNSARWNNINAALRRMGTPEYLLRIVASYLSARGARLRYGRRTRVLQSHSRRTIRICPRAHPVERHVRRRLCASTSEAADYEETYPAGARPCPAAQHARLVAQL
ncbi:unnamed protein product [Trichogramma brassicae]|uniref:CCHC-type domain-containing protein n=1 Tax=Trichogramma brassicae TaxID=86971 RepID=A0A6H5IU19_9HYME|nr:unnamed protein product [Trichogramma brassicae]